MEAGDGVQDHPRVCDNEKNQPGVALLLDELDEWLDGKAVTGPLPAPAGLPHFPYDLCSGRRRGRDNELDRAR